ncbi:hypothetical protein LCGC14_1795800 [marine sediment metagenome]|uniref:Putative regulatory protein FmdB zinc ribbon domain-containing protein n=1 Tax=marine sediment metagenome TaxID=412755 RepID=A0A0F9GR46_9ZZZZ
MPIYEYECSLRHKFELNRPMKECGESAICECGIEAERRFSPYHFKFSNPFPVSGNIAGDGEGFTTKHMGKEEYKEHKQKLIS